jgi:tryptophan synthase alpha chain
MNRLAKVFEEKKALIAFVTGGDPDIETTQRLIVALAEAGVDIVKIGVPFSDPVAGGTEIQQSDERALANGCTVDNIFDMAAKVREKAEIPLLIKSYMNPIFVYGKARFIGKCAQSGIDGVIVPDLPFEERDEIATNCAVNSVPHIPMIAPAAMGRIEMIVKDAEGFIIVPMLDASLIKLLKAVSPLPCVVGLEVPTPGQAQEVAAIADGLVIESAIVRLAAQYGKNCVGHVKGYIEKIRAAL